MDNPLLIVSIVWKNPSEYKGLNYVLSVIHDNFTSNIILTKYTNIPMIYKGSYTSVLLNSSKELGTRDKKRYTLFFRNDFNAVNNT